MGYVEKWQKSVTQREGYKDFKNEQNMMLLPLKTWQDPDYRYLHRYL